MVAHGRTWSREGGKAAGRAATPLLPLPPHGHISKMFRVATYNIQKSVGLDGRRQPERILEVIGELDADILALQEVDRRYGRRQSTLPPALITACTDYRPVPVSVNGASLGWHGNAILVRHAIRVLEARRLTLPMLEPRGAVMATVEVAGGLLRVVATHLSLVGAFRKRQIDSLTSQLHGAHGHDIPTVILGDLNEWREWSDSMKILHPRYRIISPGRSFPAAMPAISLDRIVTGPGLVVHLAGVHRSETARIASDHLPVWAELSFAERVGARPGRRHAGADQSTGEASRAI